MTATRLEAGGWRLEVEMIMMLLLSGGTTKPAVCSKCEDTEGEPLYQGILEVNTKQGENTEIASLQVIILISYF